MTDQVILSSRPYLEITDLSGAVKTVYLIKDVTTIGRFEDLNDIALSPDPQGGVTRHAHCKIEIRNSTSWISDHSTNGTEVKRGNQIFKVTGEFRLLNEDIILIKAGKGGLNNPTVYWQLKFFDPGGTVIFEGSYRELVYDEFQHKLYIITGKGQLENIPISPHQDKMVGFMIQMNKANHNHPVLCLFNDLISAIWGSNYLSSRTSGDVTHLVIDLRKKIESDPEKPVFLTSARGLGYQLKAKPVNLI
jgi:hypothetical protein